MKPKELQTFNDGIVNIYTVGNIAEKRRCTKRRADAKLHP